MPSYSFSEPCSGRDCYFCGPLDERRLSPEAEARQQREDDLQSAHDFGMHERPRGPDESYLAGFQADCPGCQTLRGLGLA